MEGVSGLLCLARQLTRAAASDSEAIDISERLVSMWKKEQVVVDPIVIV
jgi:hypothetical protein